MEFPRLDIPGRTPTLLPRILVFTGSQVYFQCRFTYRSECLHIPIRQDELIRVENWEFRPVKHLDIDLNLRPAFPLYTFGTRDPISNLSSVIGKYVKRKTTYQSDALNAVTGILNTFQSDGALAFHFQGIPISSCDTSSLQAWNRALCGGLCWLSAGSRFTRRREDFPS